MGSNQLIIPTIPLLFLWMAGIPSIAANGPPPKPVDVAMEGVVYCQSCELSGTWSLTESQPLEAAIVSVICNDHRNRVSFYEAFETDKKGYFYAQLKGFRMSHPLLDHPLHSCWVKLVSSPVGSCNVMTNVNYGLCGAPLRYDNKRLVGSHYEAVIYAAGPLALRPTGWAPKTQP